MCASYFPRILLYRRAVGGLKGKSWEENNYKNEMCAVKTAHYSRQSLHE